MRTFSAEPIIGRPYKGISLSDIARIFSLELMGPDAEMLYQDTLDSTVSGRSNVLTFLNGEAFLPEFISKPFSCAIIPATMTSSRLPEDRSYLITSGNPEHLFAALHEYIVKNALYYKVEGGIGANCKISTRASIHPHVKIGDRCVLEDFVVLCENTIVGDDVRIQANTVVGGDGFEVKVIEGRPRILSHCGGTLLSDNVEVGSSTTIDRCLRHGFTYLGRDSKISNQVQIGHCAYLDEGCILTGHVQVGNSTAGRGVFVAPSSVIKPGVSLGDFVLVGTGSVVLRNLPAHALVYGSPARIGGWVCTCRSRIHFTEDNQALCNKCGKVFSKEGDTVTERIPLQLTNNT